MNAGAKTASTGPLTAGGADDSQVTDRADVAGRLLARLSVVPVLLLMAWLLAGLPLLLVGHFTPTLMLVVWVPLAAALLVFGLRWIPDRCQGALPGPRSSTPWWAVVAVVAVAAGFGIWQFAYHSQQIIVLRDPASYAQFGYWIAHHGSLPIPRDAAAFGGPQKWITFASPAFYKVGDGIVPQFMAGLPMVLSAGYWIRGIGAALATAPVLGACGVLTFGGLTARLVGPRWAPVAALVLALSLPEQFTSRSTYSEPLAQILFLGGLCLVTDSLDRDGAATRVIAALGGLALGLTVLARIDGLSDILPFVPICGLLLLARRRQAIPLIGGLALGTAYGIVDGLVLTRPYLASIKSSLEPLVLVGSAAVVLTAVAVAGLWGRGLPKLRGKWLNLATVLPVVVIAGFALRPYLQTVRDITKPTSQAAVARYQRVNNLPIDPMRSYAEISLHWVFWYIGLPAVVLATFAAVLLTRKCLSGRMTTWTLPLVTFAWVIVACLYRPAIAPDQPWASRRLVPGVLPGFILLAVWGSGWLVVWLRQRGVSRVACAALACCCAVALLLPTAVTTFGIRVKHGPAGSRLVAHGLAFKTTYRGEVAAVEKLCRAIPPGSSVVIVSPLLSGRWTEVVRGMCDVPAGRVNSGSAKNMAATIRGIRRAGRIPVLLGAWPMALEGYGTTVREIVNLQTHADISTLLKPPLTTQERSEIIWMTEVTS